MGSSEAIGPPLAQGSIYSDPQRRFHVRVPVGWRASASENGAALSRGSGFVNVLVVDGERPGRDLVAALTGQVGQQWRDFQQLQTGGSTLAGLRADYAVSVGTNPKGIPALLKVIATTGQGRTFALMVSAPQAEFESVKADLTQIERSFSLGGQVSGAASDQGRLPDAGPLIPSGGEPVRSQASAPPRPSPPTPAGRPSPPASTMKTFQGSGFAVSLPSNWNGTRLAETDLRYRISADDGVQVSSDGDWNVMLGMCAGYTRHDTAELRTATDQFVQRVLETNAGFAVSRAPRQRIAVAGLPAESLLIEGPSRIPGEREVVWIVTVQRPQGLFHMNLICPRSDFAKYRTLFGQIVASARFD
jgi:hypothetical protein